MTDRLHAKGDRSEEFSGGNWSRRSALVMMCLALPALYGVNTEPHARPVAPLNRGVAIHTALNWPSKNGAQSYTWPPFPHALERLPVSEIRAAGFDFLRLTVNPAIFADVTGQQHRELVALLRTCIDRVLDADLRLLLDIHAVAQDRFIANDFLLQNPTSSGMRNISAVQVELARILSRYSSDRVALELWNEPAISQARRAEWETAQTRMYLAVRAAAPSLTLVLTGIGGSLHSLLSIDASVLRDSNIYYTFHYYEPAPFTHQGLVSAQDNQNVEQFFHDVPFPLTADQAEVAIIGAIGRAHVRAHDNAALRARLVDKVNDYRRYLPLTLNEAAIAQQFDKVVVWTHANGITRSQILLGEFGVMRPHVDPDARLRWIDIVRRQAERCGFGWCRWSFDNPASMGMTKNPDLVHFSPGELTALGLHEE